MTKFTLDLVTPLLFETIFHSLKPYWNILILIKYDLILIPDQKIKKKENWF